jgi:DNA-directed RNA polymerase specialized sigma24 family protein
MIKRDPKLDRSQIKAFAYKVLKRVHALGARSVLLEDVESELWVGWCLACDAYDDNGGASFKTFLYTGLRNHINRWVEKNFERNHAETVAASLDLQIGDDSSDGTLGDIIGDTGIRHDEAFQREDCFAYAMTRLSSRSQMFLTFLRDNPPELIERMNDLQAKAAYAKEIGACYAVPKRVTSAIIFDFMGASRVERKQIMDEVSQIGRLISN